MAIYRQNMSNDSRYYITLSIDETDEGQDRTLTYSLTATKTSGSGYYSNTGNNLVTITIDGVSVLNRRISYDFRNSTPKTITLGSGTLTSSDHTFSGLNIPIGAYFDMSSVGVGTATISDTFTLNTLHEPPYNISYTITETNPDLISAGISDDVFVKNLSIKEFYFTADFHDGATYKDDGGTRVINTSALNWVYSEPGTPRLVTWDCSIEPIAPFDWVEPPHPDKVDIRGVVYDNQGGYAVANDATTINPDLYDFIPYEKPIINNNSLYFKRFGQTSGRALVSLAGTFYNGVVGNVDQSSTYKPTIRYKFWKYGDTEPATFSNTIPSSDITIDSVNSTFTVYRYDIGTSDETQPNFLDPDYSWVVRFKVEDSFEEYESETISIKKGFYLWAELKDRVDFLKLTINNKPVYPNSYEDNTEIVVGTYDGKPLYRKKLTITPTAAYGTYLHGINDIKYVVNAYGRFTRTSGSNQQNLIPCTYTNWEVYLYDFTTTSYIVRFSTNQWNAGVGDVHITIEYTKDTD